MGEPFAAETTAVWHGPPCTWFDRELQCPPHLVSVKLSPIPAGEPRLEIPSLLVSGECFDPPAFEIRPTTESYIAPFNC